MSRRFDLDGARRFPDFLPEKKNERLDTIA